MSNATITPTSATIPTAAEIRKALRTYRAAQRYADMVYAAQEVDTRESDQVTDAVIAADEEVFKLLVELTGQSSDDDAEERWNTVD